MSDVSEIAKVYAKRHAAKLFDGRRGHGRNGIGSRVMSRAALEAHLAVAFDLGRATEAGLARVKS